MTKTDVVTLSDLRTFFQRIEVTIAAAERGERLIATLAPLLAGLSAPTTGGHATPKRMGRPPGSKNKAAVVASAAAKPEKATTAKSSGRVRRSPEQLAKDDAALIGYIKAHPGARSQDVPKGVGLPKPNVASGLQRLRASGAVIMTGTRGAATYTVA